MKTSMVGLVLAAILIVVAGVGFGIAQAGGTHTDGPLLSSQDQEFVPEGNWAGTDWQLRGQIEAGGLPDEVNADSSLPETEDTSHRRGGEDIDDGPTRN